MMAKLLNKTRNLVVVSKIVVADSLLSRLVGLINHKEIKDEGLWIKSCNSVHTFFMKFPIDLAFVDSNLCVKGIRVQVKPWRMVLPVLGANSVFELPAGTLNGSNLKIGDTLDVS
jgi:uncharacterized membrane protein (UPF0127 family)